MTKTPNNNNNNLPPLKKMRIIKYDNFDDLLKDLVNKPNDNEVLDTNDLSSSSSSSSDEEEIKEYIEIKTSIQTLNDLINLGKQYDKTKRYNINMKKLYDLVEPLDKLKNMIGMHTVKQNIVNHILFYLQDLDNEFNDMLHTVIQGPPGVGKTELGRILGQIYLKMGILKNSTFKIVKRSDLIAKYLGQTAIKTQRVINSCKGGIMFIDEAYSLGNPEGRDSFSKECIDTLNQNLTEGRSNFLCIIAGYKHDLQKCFFNYNKGLDRRFSIRYTINGYNGNELFLIFKKIIYSNNWFIEPTITNHFFIKNIDYFKFYGGDVEILFFNCKITHARRIFGLPKDVHKIINQNDIDKAFNIFKINRMIEKNDESWKNLYI